MNVKRPSAGAIIAVVAFVTASLAATIAMWIGFGGPIPLKPESYRIEVALKDAKNLVKGTDIRIAGIDVGSVTSTELDAANSETIVEMEIEDEFSPRPADTRVVLRQKSLLGEPYIELSTGSQEAPDLEEEGRLAPGQVDESVAFEDILNTFNPKTRKAMTEVLTDQGIALDGVAPYLSGWASTLPDFAINVDSALGVVRQQGDATAQLLRQGGGALTALSERQGQLSGFVQNSSRMFRAIAARNEELAEAIRILPTFIDETVVTSERVATFSDRTTPLLRQLTPAAEQLSPVLRDLKVVAPSLYRVASGIKPLTSASKDGVPAFNTFLADLTPFLDRSKPWLGRVIPVIDYLNDYRRELTGFAANLSAATQDTAKPVALPGQLHFLRAALPVSLESLTAFPQRFGSSRSNPYPAPGTALEISGGLPQFADYLCVNRALPTFTDPPWDADIVDNVLPFYTTDLPSNPNPVDPPAPPCRSQPALGPLLNAGSGTYPQLQTLP